MGAGLDNPPHRIERIAGEPSDYEGEEFVEWDGE